MIPATTKWTRGGHRTRAIEILTWVGIIAMYGCGSSPVDPSFAGHRFTGNPNGRGDLFVAQRVETADLRTYQYAIR